MFVWWVWGHSPAWFPLTVLIFVLIDEVLKEGYLFKPADVGRLTHETIAILGFVFGFVAWVVREWSKSRERKRGGKHDKR